MTAQEFWDKYGKNIRGLTDRKLRNAMRKYSVKDSKGEILWLLNGSWTYRDAQEFLEIKGVTR